MRSSLLPILLALGGCVHVAETHLPDGSMGYTLECRHASNCMNKAAELCNGPYRILAGGSSTGYVMTGTATPISGGGAFASSSAVPVNRSQMIVTCGR